MTYLQQLCSMIARVDQTQRTELFCQIHNEAGRFPYIEDRDQGAIILEQEADRISNPTIKVEAYRHALYRARWCAQASSSGGEGSARAAHVKEIEFKILDAEPIGSTNGVVE